MNFTYWLNWFLEIFDARLTPIVTGPVLAAFRWTSSPQDLHSELQTPKCSDSAFKTLEVAQTATIARPKTWTKTFLEKLWVTKNSNKTVLIVSLNYEFRPIVWLPNFRNQSSGSKVHLWGFEVPVSWKTNLSAILQRRALSRLSLIWMHILRIQKPIEIGPTLAVQNW